VCYLFASDLQILEEDGMNYNPRVVTTGTTRHAVHKQQHGSQTTTFAQDFMHQYDAFLTELNSDAQLHFVHCIRVSGGAHASCDIVYLQPNIKQEYHTFDAELVKKQFVRLDILATAHLCAAGEHRRLCSRLTKLLDYRPATLFGVDRLQ
jgi:myosin heavy subunit